MLDHGSTATLECQGASWSAIPSNMSVLLFGEADRNNVRTPTYHHATRPASVSRLGVVDGALTQLAQDTFKGEFIEELDLSGNCIDSVNVNAFRGLETKLQQLSLRANCLSATPSASLIYLSRLQYLHLEDNHIDRIESEAFAQNQLIQLKFLHLDGNRLTKLPSGGFKPLASVQVLTLASNRIQKVGEESLPPTLWFLDLKGNRLREIPYAALRELRATLNTFDLESNSIDTLTPGGKPALADRTNIKEGDGGEINLLLANNMLRELRDGSFSAFPRMNRLDLRYNRLATMHEHSFRGTSSLRDLDLGHNRLVHLHHSTIISFANSLRRLNLESNGFASMPSVLKHLRALESLDLSDNRLRALEDHGGKGDVLAKLPANLTALHLAGNQLSRIPASVIERMHQLRELDLSSNRIDRIEKMAFGAFVDDGTMGGSRSLVRLNLAGNLIGEVTDSGAFLYMSQLAQLDLSFNRIRRLTRVAFERLESLESLHLQANAILEFPRNALSSLKKLKYLLLDRNDILNLPNYAFQWLVHLEHLSLSHNRIHTLNAKTFHSTSAIQLKSLNLAHNRIATMHTSAFEGLPNLEHLYLNNNQLVQLQTQIISSLKSLKTLTLAHNQINETQESAFTNLPHLHRLSLAHNRLRTMKEGIVRRLPQLAHLDLSHNRIEAFDLDFLEESVHQLRYLDLSHNVIRKLELSQAKRSLLRLEAQHNQLEFVDNQMLQGFEKLESLDLSHNDLIEVGREALWKSHQLRRVILSDNNLRTLGTFGEQRMIRFLDLSSNMLSALEPNTFGRNNLLELHLSRNNFTSIPTAALQSVARSLSLLDLSHNSLHSLTRRDFQALQNLSSLTLAHNRIESIGDEAFGDLVNLRTLDLCDNPVSAWSPNAFVGISRLLTRLNLAALGLFSMPRLTAPQLKSLNLSHNKIYELHTEEFKSVGMRLESLDLAKNNLVDVKVAVLRALPNLRHLNLSGNGLRHLQTEHFKSLPQLESLHLADMGALVRLPDPSAFAHLVSLKSLDLRGLTKQTTNYNISAILSRTLPLRSLTMELWQEELGPEVLAGADLRLLRQLTIHGKNLKTIHPRAFDGRGGLSGYRFELAVEHTSIRSVPALFSHMPGVRNLRLSLRHNRIESIDLFSPDAEGDSNQHSLLERLNWQKTRLEQIDLTGNPLVCDCRMEWLSVWIGHLASSVDPQGSVWAGAKRALTEAKCSNRMPSEHHRQKHSHHHPNFRPPYHNPQQEGEERGRMSLWDVYRPAGIVSNGELLCDEQGRLVSSGSEVAAILSRWMVALMVLLSALAGMRCM